MKKDFLVAEGQMVVGALKKGLRWGYLTESVNVSWDGDPHR